MKIQGIKCPMCEDEIWSRHRHDMRHCKCEYCFVDGGREYLRMGFGDPLRPELTIYPENIEIEIEDKT